MAAEALALHRLEQAIARELELFAYPNKVWPRVTRSAGGEPILDVVIVGAGQAGTSLAVGLFREHITNILMVDRCPPGGEGPWNTWARMITLRTIKELTGPDGRIAAASFRSWYESRKGEAAWRELVRIPKGEWMDYLLWVRAVLKLPVESETEVTSIAMEGDHLRVALKGPQGSRSVLARKVVLATGVDGSGGPRRPAFTDGVPRSLWAHSADAIDFTALAGKRVAVLGAGASAFDNSATALEAGAASVVHFLRRPELPQVNALRFLETSGFFRNFGSLDDDIRLRFMRHYLSLPTPPPADTLERCRAHGNFVLCCGEGWTGMTPTDDGTVRIATPRRSVEADFAILGTGFRIDLARLPFLAPLMPHLTLWGDRVALDEGDDVDQRLGKYPYLGPAMEAVGRTPEADRALRNLHLFNISGVPSVGLISSGINGLPWGVDAIALAISRDLFKADADSFYREFIGYAEPDANEAYVKQRIAQ